MPTAEAAKRETVLRLSRLAQPTVEKERAVKLVCEVDAMTNEQADAMRNDLLDLVIEKITRIIKDPDERERLTAEVEALKH